MADDTAVWIPILPSLKDFGKNIQKGTKGAGKAAGESIAKELETAVSKAEKTVRTAGQAAERAQNRVADATGKVRVAQEQYNKALESGDPVKVAREEERLAKARRDQVSATTAAENANKDLERAQDNATRAAREQERAVEAGADSMSSFGDLAGGMVGKLGGLAAALGGVAGAAGLMAAGLDVSAEIGNMNRQLGLTGDAAALLGDEVGDVMRSGVASGAAEAAEAVGALTSQFSYLGFEGEQTAGELADNFLAITRTFGIDMAEATQTAGQLVTNGLAPDVESAADLMATALQRVPAAMRDELPEIMNEYGTNFASLGFDGKEAFDLLVSASADGKIALDKTGDALKEFGIRATDLGDTGAVEALDMLGLAGEDVQARLLAGGDTAREAFTQVTEALVGVTDPAKQAEAAVALFGTPLEDLDKTKLPSFLESLNATGEGMSGFEGTSQGLADQISNTLSGRLDALKGVVSGLAGDAFMWLWDVVQNQVIPGFQDLAGWFQRNEAWVGPLAVAIGAAATAWGLWTLAVKGWEAATKLAAAVQAGFNAVMAANPIMLVVIAIAALVAGLAYFFTQTELGKQVWQTLVDAFTTGWEWVKGAFAAAWEFISPIFTSLWQVIQQVGGIFVNVVQAYFVTYWNILSSLISFGWNYIIKPVWDAMQLALHALGMFFQWAWLSLIKPAWDALGAGISWVWQNVIRPAWDALKWALGAVGDFFNWVWNAVIKPAWDALGNGIRWVLDTVVHPAFEGLKTGLRFVQDAFATAVDFIGQMWDRIKGIVAAPIKFVIDTVYNDGIVAVWNKVAGWLGLEELGRMPMPEALGAYAAGGVLPGHTPGRDIYNFVDPRTGVRVDLGGGEGIMTTEFVDAVGGPKAIDELNARARKGLPLGHAGHYAAGGVLPGWEMLTSDIQRAMAGSVAQAFPNQRITSGTRYEDVGSGFDNHMAQRAVDFDLPGGPLASWIAREYGPSVLELFWDPGPNMVGGAPTGAIGGHSDHVHWAMAEIIDPYTGDVISMDGPGGGGVSPVRSLVAKAFSSIMDPIMGMIPEGPGLFGGVAKGMATKLVDSVKEFLMGQSGGSSPHGDWVGTPGVEQFRGLVERLLAEKGHSQALVGSVLRRMYQESTGDPNAINDWDSNALAGWPTKGLMQMRDDTFLANADPGHTNIWDPEDNLRSSLNYAMNEYGSISAAYDRAGGYDQGGWLPDDGIGINTSGMPEPVFSHDQWRDLKALIGAVIELTPAIEAWVDEGMVALEEFANGIIPAAQSEIGDGIAEFFGFGGLVTDVNSLMSEVQQAQAPTVGPVAVAEPPTAEAAEASEGGQGAVPLVHIENLHVEDEDAATAVGREVRRAVRSETLVGGW